MPKPIVDVSVTCATWVEPWDGLILCIESVATYTVRETGEPYATKVTVYRG